MDKLTEHQFHTVWTTAVGEEGYDKKFFQRLLEKLHNDELIIKPLTGMMKVHSESRRHFKDAPQFVPMKLLNEEQAQNNHGQSLEKLNGRGGLGIGEILDNIYRRKWSTTDDTEDSVKELNELLKNANG